EEAGGSVVMGSDSSKHEGPPLPPWSRRRGGRTGAARRGTRGCAAGAALPPPLSQPIRAEPPAPDDAGATAETNPTRPVPVGGFLGEPRTTPRLTRGRRHGRTSSVARLFGRRDLRAHARHLRDERLDEASVGCPEIPPYGVALYADAERRPGGIRRHVHAGHDARPHHHDGGERTLEQEAKTAHGSRTRGAPAFHPGRRAPDPASPPLVPRARKNPRRRRP